jgi:glutamyl-tRNA reductase
MYYQVISFSHKNCNQDFREKLAFACDEDKKAFLDELVGFEFIHEAFVISTCNRVEVVMATRDNFASYHSVLGLLSQKDNVEFYDLKANAKRYDDKDAVLHFFSVVSSLDSLVIGESQITGQVKEAFRFSYQNGTCSKRLNRLLSYAIKCAAEVRTVTNISQHPISIASVAVAQAHKLLQDNIQGMKGIVVGSGEMGVLAAKHLLRVGCDVVLISRDKAKVEQIASELGENVKPDTMDNLVKYLNRYRLLFSATASKEPIITKDMIENETLHRIWFDMAIPRDIDDIEFEKLTIYRIDDLRSISNDNHALREEQAIKANEIVQRYKDEFYEWLQVLSIEPVIKQMRLQINDIIDNSLQNAIKKGFVPSEYEANMKKMAQNMFNKFLHTPTKNLRTSSSQKQNASCIEEFKKIFEIDTDMLDMQEYKTKHHHKG